jgi:hypothetical protein
MAIEVSVMVAILVLLALVVRTGCSNNNYGDSTSLKM